MATPGVFDFDDELGGTEANSYVPLASFVQAETNQLIVGADDYFALHPKNSLWTSLSTSEKESFLVRATTRLDMETYSGRMANTNQRLQWPRTWIVDRNFEQDQDFLEFADGNYYQSDKYQPLPLAYATFEMALFYVEEWKEESEFFSRRDQERMESVTIGPLSGSLRKWKEEKLPDPVRRLLIAIGPGAWRGSRPPRIVR